MGKAAGRRGGAWRAPRRGRCLLRRCQAHIRVHMIKVYGEHAATVDNRGEGLPMEHRAGEPRAAQVYEGEVLRGHSTQSSLSPREPSLYALGGERGEMRAAQRAAARVVHGAYIAGSYTREAGRERQCRCREAYLVWLATYRRFRVRVSRGGAPCNAPESMCFPWTDCAKGSQSGPNREQRPQTLARRLLWATLRLRRSHTR